MTGHVNASITDTNRKLFKTKKSQRDCYNANNARNRDVYTKAKMLGKITEVQEIKDLTGETNQEDVMIEWIDNIRSKKDPEGSND